MRLSRAEQQTDEWNYASSIADLVGAGHAREVGALVGALVGAGHAREVGAPHGRDQA
jgi:hypothetical protein